MVPLHPQACPGEPDRLRWITPAFAGTPKTMPAALGALLTDGTLAGVRVEAAAVVTVLGPGHRWSEAGPRVRTALHAALADPAWSGGDPDDRLREAATDLIRGAAGDYIHSHGGGIELIGVAGGVVTVRLDGACHGCPAARATLRSRIEEQLRRRCPELREVVSV
jgi:Fe-S cluster biogenesis protein NfuA